MTASAMTSEHDQAPSAARSNARPRRVLRSTGAVLAGFFTIVVLSLVTDQVLHVLQVYPPWGQPMFDPALNALALAYRSVYTVLGGYLTARLAPNAPVRHAFALGVIGLIVGGAAAITTITKYDLGPDWYPIALALTGLPLSWLGGLLYRAKR
ncbi:MAG: hypothetical protein ACREOG_11010 [Gemmatimonadaceae bacterium]